MSQRGGRRARALRAPAHAMTACAPAQQRLLAGVGRGRGMPIVRRLAVDVTDKYWSDTLRMHGFSPTRPSAFLLEVPPPPLFVLIGHAASLTPYQPGTSRSSPRTNRTPPAAVQSLSTATSTTSTTTVPGGAQAARRRASAHAAPRERSRGAGAGAGGSVLLPRRAGAAPPHTPPLPY